MLDILFFCEYLSQNSIYFVSKFVALYAKKANKYTKTCEKKTKAKERKDEIGQ